MVWTEITRAKYCRDGLRYASDTTDEEWAMIAPYMPCKNRRGRPRVTEMRTLVNSIFFIAQSGCQWRLLPKEFPPYPTVQRYFYRWRDDGTWQKINHHLVMMVREADGREASPTAGVIDSQSVKMTEAGGPRGFDAAKKVKGRKRHLARGRKPTDAQAILNAMFYMIRCGCPWRYLPKDFPPFTTVQNRFYAWRDSGLWSQIVAVFVMDAREAEGREAV